jgi:hypothetical protein
MEGRDKEEAPGPGGKAVSLRRSTAVASNQSAASSVSLIVEGGGGAREGEGGKGGGGRRGRGRGRRGRGRDRGRGEGGQSSRSPSSSSSLVPSPSLPHPHELPIIISRRNDKAIVDAAHRGNLGEVMRLYHEDNVSLESPGDDGTTALMWASNQGHLPIVHFLVSNGAAVGRRNDDGKTAMHYAAVLGY